MGTFLEAEEAGDGRLSGAGGAGDKSSRKVCQCSESLIAAATAGHRHVVYLLVQNGADLIRGAQHRHIVELVQAQRRIFTDVPTGEMLGG